MKKSLAVVGIILAVLLAVVAYSKGSTSLEGKYVITAMEMNGKDVLAIFKEMAERKNIEDVFDMEFFKDGKFIWVKIDGKQEGTYKIEGNKLLIADGNKNLEAIIDGNSFSIIDEKEKIKMTFTKK